MSGNHRGMSSCPRTYCTTYVRRCPRACRARKSSTRRQPCWLVSVASTSKHGHDIVCIKHRHGLINLLHSSAPMLLPATPPPSSSFSPSSSALSIALTPPPASASSACSASSSPGLGPLVQELMANLLLASMLSLATPALTVRSVFLPHPTPPPPPPSIPRNHTAARHLTFSDLGKPTHPHTEVVHTHQEPRFSRLLTGQQLEERLQERGQRQQQWTSKRRQRESNSYTRHWSCTQAKGGHEHTSWPLSGIHSILEKTVCCAWDGEDGVPSGRQGCQRM